MKVALGTYEVSEDERKAVKKALGFKGGKASREEVRDYLLAAAQRALDPEAEGDFDEDDVVEVDEGQA